MDISRFGKIDTKNNYDVASLETVMSKAHAGNSLLFIGAGFSIGSINEADQPLLIASELSKRICLLGGFDEDEDLAYSADYYLKYNSPSELIGLLRNYFKIKSVKEHHEAIASANWRRVYTTNYDNAYELASGMLGHTVFPVTLDDNPSKYFRSRDICIHINGAIQTLTEDSLENSFKLSESSYTNSDAFSDSSWAYRFKKDIELCRQIVFIGYSLYDMEVKRLLVSNENIKRKTFFITTKDVTTKEHHRLSAFGEVFPIGAERFGFLLRKSKPNVIPQEISYLSSFRRELISSEDRYGDTEIRDFLLRGKCITDYIASSLTSDSSPYAIEREQVKHSLRILQTHNIIILHGVLANGKSVLAKQIASNLLIEGRLVYTIKDKEADYENDIEKLSTINQKIYLIIDDFENCIDLIRYFSSCLGDNGKLILTERPHRYRKALLELKRLGLETYNINVDYLHDNEVNAMEEIISNTGLWGERAGSSKRKRVRYLTEDCESQLSIILLNILKSPYVMSLFKKAFSKILKHPDTKKAVHAICLIQHVYPSECNKSFISDIADSNHVYSSTFEERINESSVFELQGSELVTRSSIHGTFILNSLYKSSYSIDQLVRIVEKLQRNRDTQTIEEKEMFRSIMTFSTIAAILPDNDKPDCYIEFYEKLKAQVPRVTGNPHFWLQYGMAVMSTNNLSDAEIILKTAYAKAENSINYDTTYIDNQFARLNLKKAIIETKIDICFQLFLKADDILRKEESSIYKFRQAGLYIAFHQKRYADLSKGNKVKFEHALKRIVKQYEVFLAYEYPSGDVPPFHMDNVNAFKNTLSEIAEQRKA